jgi:succinate-semialdehyde dehydrogenase/glutarate-semialdehyde dehydrogenase
MSIKSINPTNGKVIKTYQEDQPEKVIKKIEQTHKAWLSWRATDYKERAKYLVLIAEKLRSRKAEFAKIMALEMGKPLKDGEAEIEKCASVCDYYAINGESFLSDQLVATDASKSYISYQPLGIVLAIMPWNFPFWQLFRFLAPALMAGNCGLLKHASNVPGCALAIESVVKEAGLPPNVFQTLMIGSAAVKKAINHPLVKAVTLTGSTQAGIKVAQQAGSLLKKLVLELGGSDPYVILADADLESAAEACVTSRLMNNGQSCVAAKRFIIDKKVEKEFITLFKQKMQRRHFGDPLLPNADLGPMARVDLRDELHQQVISNIKAGARCILGGEIPTLKGDHAFYPPTILTGIKKGMPAYEEEIFGPVALFISAKNTEDAIRIANDTAFGLGAAVFTQNGSLGEEIAKTKLQAGCCFVNAFVKSDPRLPFGGINQSGYGRELSAHGIHEFVNIKTVWVK